MFLAYIAKYAEYIIYNKVTSSYFTSTTHDQCWSLLQSNVFAKANHRFALVPQKEAFLIIINNR